MNTLKLWLSRLAFPFFFLVIAVLAVVYHGELWGIFENREHLKALILSAGVGAPMIFMGLQVLQVVVAFIPGEITQLAGGWLFGTVMGTVYSIVGITLGSIFNFYVARLLGTRFVAAVAGKKNLEKFESTINTPRIFEVLFILYLIPGMIKDILSYVAGLSRMKLWGFVLISTVGRLPSLALSSFIGHSLGDENWLGLVISGCCVAAFMVAAWLFRTRISLFLGKMVKNKTS